jgi:hypothetical protein
MASVKSNVGKWKTYVKGRLYSGDAQGGQNLNVDLQENLADEIDTRFNSLIGTAVLGHSSWVVQPTLNSLEVKVSSGEGVFVGQYAQTGSDFTVTPTLPPSTTGVKVYIELDSGNDDYDEANNTWAVKVGWVSPASSIPTNSILLALVDTPSSGVVAAGSIFDERALDAASYDDASIVDDLKTPEALARHQRHRNSMFASRLREIIGATGNTWLDAVPNSLTDMQTRFDAIHGHIHSGTGNNGPKITAGDVHVIQIPGSTSSPPVIGITSVDVQDAIEQINTRKLALNGTQSMTGLLTLSGDPVDPLHAATKRWVEQEVRMAQLVRVKKANYTPWSTTPFTLLSAPLALTSFGGVIEIGAMGVFSVRNSGGWNSSLWVTMQLYRNGSLIMDEPIVLYTKTTQQNWTQTSLHFDCPKFKDQPGAGAVSYDIKFTSSQVDSSGFSYEPNWYYAWES